jgi:hypothetical protein
MTSIFWWPLIAATLHIVEEFVFPGGFPEWDRAYRPAYKKSITPRLHVVMNGLLIFLCLSIGFNGPIAINVAMWLTLAALLASNAIFHIVGAIKTRGYSPGMVTGIVLYLPMAAYGFAHFVGTRQASVGTAVVAAALGGSYHLWSAVMHSRRARGAAVASVLVMLGARAHAATLPPDRAAALIRTFLRFAVEGHSLPGDPQSTPPALPHRRCGGRLDPEHLPATIYVSWQLSAEGQHAAVNWRYDVASQEATPITASEAVEIGERIRAGSIHAEERAFFHTVPHGDGSVTATVGYCWGSATGKVVFAPEGPMLKGDLTVRGY